jgi:hypothetical protein
MTIVHKADMPEILFSQGGGASARRLSRLATAGELVKLYAGVYTSNTVLPPETVVLRNWLDIVGYLLPGAVVSFRSAARGAPEDGVLYVTRGKTRRTLALPGLTVEIFPGAGAQTLPHATDSPFKQVYLASEARWLLENLSVGKQVAPRVLNQDAIEQRLDRILTLRGEGGLNQLRDAARALANTLGMPAQFARLDGLLGELMGTRPTRRLTSQQGIAIFPYPQNDT